MAGLLNAIGGVKNFGSAFFFFFWGFGLSDFFGIFSFVAVYYTLLHNTKLSRLKGQG